MDPKHLIGYGYTDQPRRPLSAEQYSIALTSLNNLSIIAVTVHDLELYRSANEQLHRLVHELRNNGYQHIWSVDTQSYTVVPK